MWEQYEPPAERPTPQSSSSGPAYTSPRGSRRPGTTGASAGIGLVAVAAVIGIGVAVASSGESSQQDDSAFYSCVERKAGQDDSSLLSPADWCELEGYDAPSGYVDDYEPDLGPDFGIDDSY